MERTIKVTVRDLIASQTCRTVYVCGNSEFVIEFDFDDEWKDRFTKTARFKWNGQPHDVVFDGNRCPVPVISDAFSFTVGVFAGNLRTTTDAYVSAKKGALCGGGLPHDPPPDVYAQIMEKLNNAGGVTPEQIEAAVEAYLTENPIDGITQEELEKAVEDALQAAKVSGEFKGDKGDKGDKGNDGAPGPAGPSGADGKSGVYIGSEEPNDPGVSVWIDNDGEADPTTGAAYTCPVLIADETVETEDGSAIAAYVKEFDAKYRRISATMHLPDSVGGAKYLNIWNENVEAVKGANASKSIYYISGAHRIVAFDVETTGTHLDGMAGTGTSNDNGYTTAYMLVNKLTRNDHINAVYEMKYITGFSVCFSIPSGTKVVVYGWPYEGDGGDDA